jgi:hypothetical protein
MAILHSLSTRKSRASFPPIIPDFVTGAISMFSSPPTHHPMRTLIPLLCLLLVSCDDRQSSKSHEAIPLSAADVAWASEIQIYKKSIGSLVDWPVHAVGLVVVGDDGKILQEFPASTTTTGAGLSSDSIIRLAISREDQIVKCRLGVEMVTINREFDGQLGPFRGWTDGCEPVDGIVLVTSDGETLTTDGEAMMRSKGKKLGFKLYGKPVQK